MKLAVSCSLIVSLAFPFFVPIGQTFASDSFISNQSDSLLLAQRGGGRGGGGNRGGGGAARSGGGAAARSGGGNRGGGGRSFDRSQMGAGGSGRVDRGQAANRDRGGNRMANQGNRNFDRSQVGAGGSGRIDRGQTANRDRAGNRTANQGNRDVNRNRDQAANRDRNQINSANRDRASNRDLNRTNNIDRDQARNRVNNSRDLNFSNDRDFSGRVGRTAVNTGNRNVVVNPRAGNWGGAAWGWNGGRAWVPNMGYWGGGFWGGIAAGALVTGVTSAIVNSNNQPDYVVIEQNSPGYTLFDSYGLSQVPCVDSGNLVYIYGPQESLMCANPNSMVPAGEYEVSPDNLTLVAY